MVDLRKDNTATKSQLYGALKTIVDSRKEAKKSQHVSTDALLETALDEAEALVDRIEEK